MARWMHGLSAAADAYRNRMLRMRLTSLARTLRADSDPPPWLLQSLVTGWANPWSADSTFLASMLRWHRETSGPVLECGSGLTTVVLATAAWTTGRPSVALEEDARWQARLASAVPKPARSWLDCKVLPLISYGDFDWYDVGTVHLPETIGFVVCDGPRGRTRGGRYGLGPIMKDRLASGCIVLLDDTHRTGEREILDRWCTELPAHVIEASEKFTAIKIGTLASS